MQVAPLITNRLPPQVRHGGSRVVPRVGDAQLRASRRRIGIVGLAILLGFGAISGQLIRLALTGGTTVHASMAAPLSTSWARPDIVDRKGRLLASDVLTPSLYADPSQILDLDDVIEKLRGIFPGMDEADLRQSLQDRRRRFVWLRRGLPPKLAQAVHNLGLPGLAFRRELRRIYPAGALAGHVLGAVDVDNKGISGIERHIDDNVGIRAMHGPDKQHLTPVVLSLDIGVQHALEGELGDAMIRYQAKGAAAVVIDVATGEIAGAASLPSVDPNNPALAQDPARLDKLAGGTYELGSIFKAMSVAMALDAGTASLDKIYDVTRPLMVGRHALKEHGPGRPLNVREIFIYSSNVGAGMLALEAGTVAQQALLQRLGLLEPVRTEAGALAVPALPAKWDEGATITVSFGHGLAVAPLQFAAAAAPLVNGGYKVTPTYISRPPMDEADRQAVLSSAASNAMRELMRLNVTNALGTGKRADAPGYRVGGKTGTAEMPGPGGYQAKKVISSFLGAFPMDEPKYLTLVVLFEPRGSEETRGQITASVNAAPVTARLVSRIAPLLGVLPR